jgi:putative nucleotidyltransferase with HDIG domain
VSFSVSEMLPNVRQSLAEIPPLPRVVVELMREVQKANSSADSVAHVAATDPVLAAALLRTVNSSAMGLKRKNTSDTEAVSYLGFGLVKTVLVRLRLDETLPTSGVNASAAENLWVHSLAVSYVADVLAERVAGVDRGFVSTVGLLHDIGKLAILSQPGLYRSFEQSPIKVDDAARSREAQTLGTDHAGLGASLAHTWGLPSDLVQAIRYHHHPEKAYEPTDPLPLRQAVYVVFIANQLAKLGFSHADDIEIDPIPAEAAEVLGISCELESLMDANVRRAIGKAILFAAENTKQSKTSIKRLIQLHRGEAAMRLLGQEESVSPCRVTIDDAAPLDLLDQESDAACLFRAAGSTRESDIAKLIDAGLFHQVKLDLPDALQGPAAEVLRCLLPNLIQPSPERSVELVQQFADGVFSLAIRCDTLKFTDRVGPATSGEQGVQLLAREFANVMNLGWVKQVSCNTDGTMLMLTLGS